MTGSLQALSVSVAPAGTPPGDGPWFDLGHTLLEPSSSWLDHDDTLPLPHGVVSFDPEPVTIGFDPSPLNPDVFALVVGAPREEPRYQLMWEQTVPGDPVAPRKRKGLTGKAYRAARRGYARRHRAWVRAGRPDNLVRTVLPNVRIDAVDPVPGMLDTYSIGCSIAPM